MQPRLGAFGQAVVSKSRQSHQRQRLTYAASQPAPAIREINFHKRHRSSCGDSQVREKVLLGLLSPLRWDGRLEQLCGGEVELGSPRAPPLALS